MNQILPSNRRINGAAQSTEALIIFNVSTYAVAL